MVNGRRIILFGLLTVILAACGTPFPQVTPTVAPSPTATRTPEGTRIAEEPSRTPIPLGTDTPTVTSTATMTVTPTDTLTATITPTATNTLTGTPPPTNTPTDTPTATETDTPTATPTPTNTVEPSPTDLPLPLTDTPSPVPTDTSTPTATNTLPPSMMPTATQTPTQTPTRTPSATATVDAQATATANQIATRSILALTPSPLPTWTPQPTQPPTRTLQPTQPPTQDVTPTLITATPGGAPLDETTAIPSTPQPDVDAPTATVTPFTPTPLPQEQITTGFVTPLPAPVFSVDFNRFNAEAFQFNLDPNALVYNGETIGGTVSLFAPNPADASSYARTNAAGSLVVKPIGSPNETTVGLSPYYDGFNAADANQNKNFISALAWSPDGQKIAFLIEPPPGTDNINAGVWYQDFSAGGATFPILRDCPQEGWNSCGIVTDRPTFYQSVNMQWSPDSSRVLITMQLPTEGRRALDVRPAVASDEPAKRGPDVWRFDSGTWLNNDELLVSGRDHATGRVLISVVRADFDDASNPRVIYDASANGLWLQDAVPSGGVYYALGKPGAPDGALSLYRIADGQAQAISAPIGNAYPQQVFWSGDRRQVVVTVNGQQYLINAQSGAISQPPTGGTLVIGGNAPSGVAPVGQPDSAPVQQGGVPDGILEGSRYTPGQQVQYIGGGARNLRSGPTLGDSVVDVVNPFEFVAVLAGPYQADGFGWWRVQTARNIRGWIAVDFEGGSLFNP